MSKPIKMKDLLNEGTNVDNTLIKILTPFKQNITSYINLLEKGMMNKDDFFLILNDVEHVFNNLKKIEKRMEDV